MNSHLNTPTAAANPRPWPYPFWVAHRGAGRLAPENTLAAFRVGAGYGYRMFECDVKISHDESAFLLHDDTLERTTNGSGLGGALSLAQLRALDAGGWHSPGYAGESPPTLVQIAQFCIANQLALNIELKPSPGLGFRTGQKVADEAAQLWREQAVPPLLTSFDPQALEGAMASQPTLPRGLLIETIEGDYLGIATRLGCVATVCDHKALTPQAVRAIQACGMKALCYTANEASDVARLLAMGIDGIITDRLDRFAPASR